MTTFQEGKQGHVKWSNQQYCKMILLFIVFIYKPVISLRIAPITGAIECQSK